MVKKGWRNVVRVHQVDPGVGIGLSLVCIPQGLPFFSGKGTPSTVPVCPLESELPCNDRMFVASGPWRVSSTVPLLANFYNVQHHRGIQHYHVADDGPRMRLSRKSLFVPVCGGNPAVQSPGVILP